MTLQNTLSIGGVELPHRAILAPMSGVTDRPFRRMVRSMGGGLVVTEMVASAAIVSGVRREMRKLKGIGGGIGKSIDGRMGGGDTIADDIHDETPFALQLAGTEPQVMAEAARIGEAMGASIIDINMGCPARKVIGKAAGSALMRDEKLCAEIFAAMRAAVRVPVTVKMRLGWDAASRNAPRLARMAEAEGLCMVSVHGRTRCDFFKGHADWDALAAVRDAIAIPLIVNGDIKTPDDAITALEKSGADGVMIGRAAMGAPWLVGDTARRIAGMPVAPAPSLAKRHVIMREHLDLMLRHYGTGGLRLARKHIAAYTKGMGGAALMRQLANNAHDNDTKAVFAAIDDFFVAHIEAEAQAQTNPQTQTQNNMERAA